MQSTSKTMKSQKKALFTLLAIASLCVTGCGQIVQELEQTTSQQLAEPSNVDTKSKPKPKTKPAYVALGKNRASFTKKGEETEYFDIDVAMGKKGTVFLVEGNAARLIVDWSDGYRSAYALYDTTEKWGKIHDYDKTKPYGERYDYKNATKMKWKIEKQDIVITADNGNITVLGGEGPGLERQLLEIERVKGLQAARYEKQRKERLVYSDMQLGDLFDNWQKNRLRALKKYNGKEVTVRGYIDGIYEDKFEVKQEGASAVLQIFYGYSDEINQWLMDRNQGDLVTVKTVLGIEGAFGQPIIKNRGRFSYGSGHTPIYSD